MSIERSRILKLLADGKISAQEAEDLLDALGKNSDTKTQTAESMPEKILKNIKYIYVKVTSTQNDNVDIRVPIGLIRAGMRLTTLIPAQAMEQINTKMHEKGISFDLNNIKPDDIEELIKNLSEMEVNVNSKNGDIVKIYCA
jgi:hypothetical protein